MALRFLLRSFMTVFFYVMGILRPTSHLVVMDVDRNFLSATHLSVPMVVLSLVDTTKCVMNSVKLLLLLLPPIQFVTNQKYTLVTLHRRLRLRLLILPQFNSSTITMTKSVEICSFVDCGKREQIVLLMFASLIRTLSPIYLVTL